MKGISLWLQELKTIVSNRKMLVPIIAVLFIPLLYSGVFLWAFWNPYGHLDQLPVAVVNNDHGTVFNGEKLRIGNDLMKKLKEKRTFAWHFVSEKEAVKGLKQRKYYMVVKIPENFSENAATIQNEHPKRMDLIYMPDEGSNFLSAQIGSKAVEKIKEEIATTVTAAYAEAMFDSVKKMAKGLQDASSGATRLHEGISSAKDGAMQLQEGLHSAQSGGIQLQNGTKAAGNGAAEIYKNLSLLAEKSASFEDALKSASEGAGRLNEGLQQFNDGLGRLAQGQSQLLDGAKKARDGTEQLSDGLKRSVVGMKQMQEKAPQLTAGALQLKNGANNLSVSLEQWKQGAESTKAGAVQVSDGLQQVLSQLDAMIAQTTDANDKAALQALKNNLLPLAEGSKQVAGGVAQLSSGASALKTGADQLALGSSQLYDGEQALSGGFRQLLAGQERLASGADALLAGQEQLVQGLTTFGEKVSEAKQGATELAEGSGQLATGLHQLADGSARMHTGANQLALGSGALVHGMSELNNGTSKLLNGINRLSDGSNQLTAGMQQLTSGSKELAEKLTDGAKQAGDVKANDEIYRMFAEPVKIKNEQIHHVPNYGTGMTPYLLSLGLFVGTLLSTIVFPLRESVDVPRSGFSWFISKFGILLIIGTIQALLADAVLLFGLGIDVQSVAKFIAFSIITSITFMSLIQFLVTSLGDPGRFIGIIILILQLTSSAGTFPIELVPKVLQHITPCLPMTYSIRGFRAVISTGDFRFMWENAFTLIGYSAVSVMCTILYFSVLYKKQFYKVEQNATKAPQV
ncbi:YhgE/Pip domain-containing protein [Anoxybacteroides tepidamans]|uniref:YhgE/Pip domain-containing protein n=1 Tax=Anoxybacteroides tepidamans TaxID=265948 RepID=UPI00047F6E1F|nr:YhgE/Pip domain-containing protein [Anoxybacillus tepidamans]